MQQIERDCFSVANVGPYIYTTLAFLALLGAPYIYDTSSLRVKRCLKFGSAAGLVNNYCLMSCGWMVYFYEISSFIISQH